MENCFIKTGLYLLAEGACGGDGMLLETNFDGFFSAITNILHLILIITYNCSF